MPQGAATTAAGNSTDQGDSGPAKGPLAPTRREREALSTFAALISTVSDFLGVAIHQILYERDIYPKGIFIDANKYKLAIKQSENPRVNKWVADAVKACSEELLQNSVKRISIVILSPDNEPLERFVFDMSSFPFIPESKHNMPLLLPETQVLLPGQTLLGLEAQFRACLQKLKFCSVPLGKLPKDCTIGVVIELHEEGGTPQNYLDIWMPQERQSTSKSPDPLVGSAYNSVKTTPIRAVETGVISMGVWVEETARKAKLAS